MTEPTHTPPASTDHAVKVLRWCHWHQNVAVDTVLIGADDRISGPPFLLYACPPCVEKHDLRPMEACT
jgi:hypothetical protein